MEWLDDVSGWKAGDAAATERLREYVTPFVHGVLLAQWPHHQTNARMGQVLDDVMAAQQQVKLDAQFVQVAVAIARQASKRALTGGRQERPSPDPTVSEGRQWLERVRTLPEARRERVLWRLTEGIPGPELCEVLGLSADEVRVDLERGLGATMVPAQSLVGADYVWDLSSEPTTALARLETWATSLRFDPMAAPEPDDAAQNGATFEDLSSVLEAGLVHPEANPFGNADRTAMPRAPRSPSSASFDEKTHGGFDLPAAARGLVPKVDASPSPRSGARAAMVIPGPERRREDSSKPTLPIPSDERPRPSRPRGGEPKPDEERSNRARNPELAARDEDDERPSRSRIAVGALKGREDSGRKRNPELEHRRQAARTVLSHDVPPTEPSVSVATPGGPVSEPSLEPTDPERAPSGRTSPLVTEPIPRPVTASSRLVWLIIGVVLVLVAVAWRVGAL